MTVTVAVPVTPPEVARMTELPVRPPLIKPVELTAATSVFELDHETLEAAEPLIVAVACTEVPDTIVLAARVTEMEEGGAVVEEPDPPQAATVSETLARIAETERISRSP